MFQPQRPTVASFCLAAILSASAALTLTGCGMTGSSIASSKAVTSVAPAGSFTGSIHGGQQPVIGAAVKLWAAGVTGASPAGYGANSTLIASTTTDSSGNFTFNNGSGASPCTTGQYLYITSTGGDSGSGVNPQLALMSAIPQPCSPTTGAQFVNINELTTVASVTALQQFMSITAGTVGGWKIGAPASNVVGLANAFLTVGNLVNIATGATATSSVSNAISNTVGGVVYTTIVDPDYQKLNTLADILAYCVNSAGGTTCTGLFADVTPGASTAPADTIQAMYYLATNPGGLTMPLHGNAVGSPSYLCTNYPSAASPFQPTSTCATVYDWTISVKLKTTNSSAATVGTAYPASLGIDGNGNVWVGGGNGATAPFLNQFSPLGALNILGPSTVNIPAGNLNFVVASTPTALAFAPTAAATVGYARPFSVAVDTNNNAFMGSYNATIAPTTMSNSGATTVVNTGLVLEMSSTGTVTPILAAGNSGALAIDGSNNVFVGDIPFTGKYYLSELPASGSYATLYEGTGRGSNIYNSVYVDGTASQYGYGFGNSTTCTNFVIQRVTSAQQLAEPTTSTATTSPGNITLPSNCAYAGAPDAAGNLWTTALSYTVPLGALTYVNIAGGSASPVVTTVATGTNATTTGTGGVAGVDYPVGVAVDGVGNVWTVNRPSSTYTGISELVPTTSGTSTTVTALSPSGPGVYGFQSGAISGANAVAIDPSGNLWVMATAGSYLYYVVGAAAPVITPIASAIAAGKIGVRP